MEEAEKKDMLRMGKGCSPGGRRRISVESCVFSGIDRKEGMLYL